MLFSLPSKTSMPEPEQALPGRETPVTVPDEHYVLGTRLQPPYPKPMERAIFGLGCFWGAEKRYWEIPGVYTTAVGYAGGFTPNPSYDEVCTGRTGHNEVVLVVFDPKLVSYRRLLREFWEAHDPTQGMRQGNDVGTQYRSGIYTFSDTQHTAANQTQREFAMALQTAGHGAVTTEVISAPPFYYAEAYHQQYLAKNPGGYCGLGGTGVCLPAGE